MAEAVTLIDPLAGGQTAPLYRVADLVALLLPAHSIELTARNLAIAIAPSTSTFGT